MIGNVVMSDNDFQNAQIQKALLDLSEKVGGITADIKILGEGLKENSRRVQHEADRMQKSIDHINNQVDNLSLKAKYWKFGICFVLGCGSIVASLVHFGNEVASLMKNFFGAK